MTTLVVLVLRDLQSPTVDPARFAFRITDPHSAMRAKVRVRRLDPSDAAVFDHEQQGRRGFEVHVVAAFGPGWLVVRLHQLLAGCARCVRKQRAHSHGTNPLERDSLVLEGDGCREGQHDDAGSHLATSYGRPNTEINCEGRAILALADFV